ncbi:MAG: 2-hydroxychromene-2-carboxylate isomerase [Pseudomonadota bacterium]
MTTLEFCFDFASPNAYLAYRALPGVIERTGAELQYTPVLLGGLFKVTGNQSPIVAYANVPNKMAYEQLEIQRFIKKHSLTQFKFNPNFPINTLLLMRGAIVADRDGRLEEYVEAGFSHMWEAPKKMDEPDVFTAALSESGFEGASILERTQDPAVKQALMDNTSRAVKRGAFGAPTFFVGEEIYFGKDRLGQVEEALGAAA